MKQKSFFFSLLTMIMVAMLSVGFSSCGNDDDQDEEESGVNNGGDNNDSDIRNADVVGTWMFELYDDDHATFEIVKLEFKANKTGTYFHKAESTHEEFPFTYIMTSNNKGTIRIVDEVYNIELAVFGFEIKGNELYLYPSPDQEYGIVLLKQ